LAPILPKFNPLRLEEASTDGAPAWDLPATSLATPAADTRQILTFTYFTLICYLSIGLPLAILPA
jgi:hypothetical protein